MVSLMLLLVPGAEARRPVPAPVPAPPPVPAQAPVAPAPSPAPVPLTSVVPLPCGWPSGTSFRYRIESTEERTSPGAVSIVTKMGSEQEFRVVDGPTDRIRVEAPAATDVTVTVSGDPLLRQVTQAIVAEADATPLTMVVELVHDTDEVRFVNDKEVLTAMGKVRAQALQRVAGTDPVERGGMIDSLTPSPAALASAWLVEFAHALRAVCVDAGPEQTYSERRLDPVFAQSSPVEGTLVGSRDPDGLVELVDQSTVRVDIADLLAGSGVQQTTVSLKLSDTWRIDPSDGWPVSISSTVDGDVLDQTVHRQSTWTRLVAP